MAGRYQLGVILLVCVDVALFKQIPDYIHICKRDQNTINECALKSIESLKPKLIEGIPELGLPGIEPFSIPEVIDIVGDSTSSLKATGENLKVSGGGNFTIKSLHIDLKTYGMKARVRFPKLMLNGRYKIDTQILVLPIKGQGKLHGDASRCEAEFTLRAKTAMKNGKEYIHYDGLDTKIHMKDYRVRLDGLFNGDKVLGDVANQALHENRDELLKTVRPYLERAVSRTLLTFANKIVDDISLDELMPNP